MEYFTDHTNSEFEPKKEPLDNSPGHETSTNSERKVTTNSTYTQTKKPKSASKSHSCYVCGKTLSSTSSYYVHMKQHSGHKPYHCPMCEVSFCRKPYLEVHLRTHTGERPFQCTICLKRFTQKSSLNIHKRVHTGERPYSCDICDKKFAVKSYVDAHRWTHVFEKPLNCEKCQIPFNSKTQYILHMRSHSSALAYECPCGRTFTKDSYLIRHQMKVHHPNPTPTLNLDSSSISDLAYNHVFVPNNPLIKKTFEANGSSNELTQEFKKASLEVNLATPVPLVSTVIRNGIQSYMQQESSSQLAKL